MFNKTIIALKNFCLLTSVLLLLFSCKEEHAPLTFKYQTIVKDEHARVDINYPKAEGESTIAKKINTSIENFLANEINMSERIDRSLTLENAIQGFDQEYKSFKDDFSDTTQQWEALIESELIYESDSIISIAINAYMDTGGAHGNSHVTFLNFDHTNGRLLKQKDFIKDMDAFKKAVFPYFEKASQPISDETSIEDPFYGEGFQLPENIGFGDDGLILLYNVYEIASYAQGVTEFTIPYDAIKPFLNRY